MDSANTKERPSSSTAESPAQTKPKPRVYSAATKKAKRECDRRRQKTRVNIGEAFTKWRALMESLGIKKDSQFAFFLIESYMKTKEKQVVAWVSVNVPVCQDNVVTQSFDSSEDSPDTLIKRDEDCKGGLLMYSEVQDEAELCSQNENIPTKYQLGNIEVKQEPEQTEVQLSEPEATAPNDDSDVSEEEELAVKKKKEESSDEDWFPQTFVVKSRNCSSEEDSDEELEHSDNDDSCRQSLKHLCTECGTLYGNKKPHTCTHKLKPYVCNMCGRRYATEGSLKIHSKAHTNNSEHRCWCCFAVFKTKQEKVEHKRIHRNQSKPYQCRHCPKSFAVFAERTKHNKIHRGPFEYKCDLCGISFWARMQLERHMVVHTGVKPYKCLVCERGFNQAGHLKSHMRLHTGERPYACPHCDKAFNHNVSLKSHVQRYHPSQSEDRDGSDVVIKHELIETGTAPVDAQKGNMVQNQQETMVKSRYKRPKTGRPLGRPKRPATEINIRSKPKSSSQKIKSPGESDDENNDSSNDEEFFDENNDFRGENNEEFLGENNGDFSDENDGYFSDANNGDDDDDDVSFDLKQGRRRASRKRKPNLSSGKPRGRPRKM